MERNIKGLALVAENSCLGGLARRWSRRWFGSSDVGEEAMFSEALAGTKEGAVLSGLRSYRIEDNPDYAELFPEARGGDTNGAA